MAFFDKLGKKLEGMVQDAQEYTSDFIEINRLNGAIRSEREAIDSLQRSIGAAMHRHHQAGEPVPEDIRASLDEITQRLEKIAGLETRIEDAKRSEREAHPETADETPADETSDSSQADEDAVPLTGSWTDRARDDEADNAMTHEADSEMADEAKPAMTMELDEPGPTLGQAGYGRVETVPLEPLVREDRIRHSENLMGEPVTTEADLVNEQADARIQPLKSDTAEQVDRPRRFCTNCGSPLMPGKPFCGNCGQRND